MRKPLPLINTLLEKVSKKKALSLTLAVLCLGSLIGCAKTSHLPPPPQTNINTARKMSQADLDSFVHNVENFYDFNTLNIPKRADQVVTREQKADAQRLWEFMLLKKPNEAQDIMNSVIRNGAKIRVYLNYDTPIHLSSQASQLFDMAEKETENDCQKAPSMEEKKRDLEQRLSSPSSKNIPCVLTVEGIDYPLMAEQYLCGGNKDGIIKLDTNSNVFYVEAGADPLYDSSWHEFSFLYLLAHETAHKIVTIRREEGIETKEQFAISFTNDVREYFGEEPPRYLHCGIKIEKDAEILPWLPEWQEKKNQAIASCVLTTISDSERGCHTEEEVGMLAYWELRDSLQIQDLQLGAPPHISFQQLQAQVRARLQEVEKQSPTPP